MNYRKFSRKCIIFMLFVVFFSTFIVNLQCELENFPQIQFGHQAYAASDSYYYDKYNVVPKYNFRVENSANPGYPLGYGFYTSKFVEGYSKYNFNSRTGKFSYDEAFKVAYMDDDLTRPIYQDFGNRMCVCTSTSYMDSQKEWRTYWYMLETYLEGEQAGDIVQGNLIAQNNTYPDNGKHTDGYWYIKKGIANYNPTLTNTTQDNKTYSILAPTMTVTGIINDADLGDTILAKYRIDGSTGQAGNTICSMISDKTAKAYSTTIDVSSLLEGKHILYQWAEDNKGGITAESQTVLFIDKSAPIVSTPTVTVNSSSQISVIASASDPVVSGASAGLDLSPYLYNQNGTDVGTWGSSSYIFSGLSPNTRYTYKYRAKDKVSNVSAYSTTVSKYTFANIPTNVRVTNSDINSISIGWDTNGNPAGTVYELHCNETASTIYVGSATSYAHTGRSPGITYSYKVRALNGDSVATAYTSNMTYRINTQPNLVNSSVVNSNSLTFTWSANGNGVGTEYEAQLINQLDGTVIGTKSVNSTSVSFTGLDSNVQYTVKIRTRILGTNYTGYVNYSVYTAADIPSLILDGAYQTEVIGSIGLNGNPVDTEVLVERSTTDTFTSSVVVKNWDTSLSFTDSGLLKGVTYYYRAMARNAENLTTGWSSVQSTVTIPDEPSKPNAAAIDSNSINIDWGSVLGATSYDVYRDGVIIGNTSSLMFNDTGLNPNTLYTYTIVAKNTSGESAKSIDKQCYTLAVDPTGVLITGSSSATVDITLTSNSANGTAPEYKVEIKPYGGGDTVSTTDWSIETNLTLTGLKDNSLYDLWITTRNGDFVQNLPVKMITNFTSNRKPKIKVDSKSITASAISPTNIISMEGTCYDFDSENVTISATIDGVTKSTTISPAPSSLPNTNNWKLIWNGSELSEGLYTNITITATDAKSSISTILFEGNIVIDKTGPTAIPVLSPNVITPTSGTVTVDASNFGDAFSKEYRIDGGEWIPYTEPIAVKDNCTIEVRGLDEYGNPSDTGIITIGNIDNKPPTSPTVMLSDADWTSNPSITVTITDGVDSIAGVLKSQIKIGDGEWVDYTGPFTINTEGKTTVTAVTIDNLGHVSSEASMQVKIDRTSPIIKRIYIDNNTLYVVAQDALGLHTTPYKYKLKSTPSITDVESVEKSSDPFQLALLIESDRDIRQQSTAWVSLSELSHVKMGDVYIISVKDQANNVVSQQVTVNKYSGTLYGELSPEEILAMQNNSSSSQEVTKNQQQIEADKALAQVTTIANDTPINSHTGSITVDLSSLINTLSKSITLADCKFRLELTEKSTGFLVYSKILDNTSKIVIPDLDDTTTYVVKVVIIDKDGHEVNSKTFEQSTPDRTPPIISALRVEDNVLTVTAKDNVNLATQAYKYELISVNITTASATNNLAIDAEIINRLSDTLNKVSSNEWNMTSWTSENHLDNVDVNMVIKTIVKDSSGNTTEQIISVDSSSKDYANVINADKPYVLNLGITGNISTYFGEDSYEYSSSDSSIAKVDKFGNITGLKKGEVIITAKDINTGEIKQLLIKVKNVNTLNIRRIIVEKDSSTNLKILYREFLQSILGTDEVVWIVMDNNIADVNKSGILTAKNTGLTKVTAEYQGKNMPIYVIVANAGTVKSNVQHIAVEAPFVIKMGTQANISNLLRCVDFKENETSASNFTVFESSDDSIVSIENGKLIAKREGYVDITAIDLINNIYSKVKVYVSDISLSNPAFVNEDIHWSKKYLKTNLTKCIIKDDGLINPDGRVNNNEFLTLLTNTLLADSDMVKPVDRENFTYKGLNQDDENYCYSANIISQIYNIYGYKVFGDSYNGEVDVTRGQVAEIVLALTKSGLDKKVTNYKFIDLKASKYETALRYCIETGIFTGCGYNRIEGDRAITKAELLVVLNKLAEMLNR